MASEKARLAKDKGNAAFRAADYPTAIGHYTEAILADSTDHTFFLNRAAAYLKLGKSVDAERDCTKVLALSSDNVKALFRRGQARRAIGNLGDAQADLDKALALEPANESVKQEILELEKLSQQQMLKQRPKHSAESAAPKRRRVPIEIVEANAHSDETRVTELREDLLRPVSSRPLESRPSTTPAPSSKPQTFSDAKQTREESKSSRVSGGIFRPTGNHTIVTRIPRETASTPGPAPPSPNALQMPPTTLFQFTKSWQALGSETDRWNLIRTISPSQIPALFQVSLEPELLKSVLHTFQTMLAQDSTEDTRDVVRDYLLAFSKVQRFGTVMLFMDKEERRLLDLLSSRS